MIDAKELRIGNWVRSVYPINKEPFQVYPMWFKQLPTDKDHNLIVNNWKPIPLTEQWLLDFGFDKKGLTYVIENRQMILAVCIDGSCGLYNSLDYFNRGSSFNRIVKINHVHQLQNLYFALTGEDLHL